MGLLAGELIADRSGRWDVVSEFSGLYMILDPFVDEHCP
jgi:hypothetical protein